MQEKAQYTGLSQREADRLLRACGENRLAAGKKTRAAEIFVGQLRDAMTVILLAASAISVIMGGWKDAVPIIIIVVMNTALGFFQEYRCEKTLEKMEALAAPTANVYRDGKLVKISAAKIVVGDVIEICAGDRFPADCLLLSQNGLMCDESALTGENEPVGKKNYCGESVTDKQGLDYMGYMGTSAVAGKARCRVCAIGKDTQMGAISQMLSEIEAEQTPLQKKLGELGKALAAICIGVCVLVFVAGVIRGENAADMFFTAVTVAIAAIPEGLPAAVTIALALAVRRMMSKNALVHSLHSVETLGCTSVIYTDKTGTLTKNEMTVRRLCVMDGGLCEYMCDSGVKGVQKIGESGRYMAWDSPVLSEALLCAALCSNASRTAKRSSADLRNRGAVTYEYSGSPTEIALLKLCADCGIDTENLLFTRIDEKPFDSQSKYMSVTCRDREGRRLIFEKGAPDVLAGRCTHRYQNGGAVPLTERERAEIGAKHDELAAAGLRLIAFAEAADGYVIFLGFAAMTDPLRPQAREAVAECRRAGIRTVMITGDHKLTACAAAREAGILTPAGKVCTGRQLDKMTDGELAEKLNEYDVFSRVTPAHKLRIVKACKQSGAVCAMTGDGVNDAPAVKEATVGVAMGISGTDVTKQAADIVLLDDNFATLVSAVREGRAIYANIRKFVKYLIACNIGEVLTMLGAIIMGMPLPLLPAQLLLINLVTDGLPAAALSAEEAEEAVMKKPPRAEDDSFFSGGLMSEIICRGILIALCTLCCFGFMLSRGCGVSAARTGAVFTLVMSQLIYVFECRSDVGSLRKRIFKKGGYTAAAVISSAVCTAVCAVVPVLAGIFSLEKLSIGQIVMTVVLAAAVPIAAEVKRKISVSERYPSTTK